jgi:transposase
LVNSTIEDVSLKEDVGYKEIEALLGRWIENRLDWRVLKKIRLLGLDEIALRKGHRDFVVLVTARMADGEVKIVAVLPDRTKATVRKFLESIPKRIKRVIRTVCTDLYEGYINAVKEVLSQAMIVADRFHIAKLYRDCADQLRKKEQRRLKKELPKEEYQKLKGAMWAFRKKKSDLEAEEEKVLNLLFEDSPELKKAYNYREQLSEIFEEDLTKEEAQKKIRNWSRRVKAAGVKCFDGFIETLWKWREEITNYFVNRDNSGFVEGFNNKVKVLKRRCYGIFNLTHLFQRIYLDVEGYRQFARTN